MNNLDVDVCHELDFMVHSFTRHTSPSNASSSSSVALIRVGHNLINQASGVESNNWSSVKPGPFGESLKLGIGKYTLTQPPPVCAPSQSKNKASELKEWGAPIDADDDLFCMSDLQEFESTDLSHLSVVGVKRLLAAPVFSSSNWNHEPYPATEEAARKRRRLDSSPLYNVIPQPHFHPSPTNHTMNTPRISPYTKAKPIPIPPYALPSSPSPPYSRNAWLIPIRGILPWDNCTSGLVLDITDSHTPSPANNKTNGQITWTHPSLVSFWSFLLAVRQAGNLGPIGISFHAATPSLPSFPHSSSNISWIPSGFDLTSPEAGNQEAVSKHVRTSTVVGARTGASTPAHTCRVPLASVDHIKVYHNAENAMYVRNALDAWGFPVPVDENGAMGKLKKIRMLKGAKLVLVDERSRGVLIS